MLKYYKQYKEQNGLGKEIEITYDEALRTMLGTWRDTDMTRDMLTIQNYIECNYSWIRVDDPDSELKPIPGVWNRIPEDAEYDEDTWMRIK